MRVERFTFRLGWNILFYVSKDENAVASVEVHIYTPFSGRRDEVIKPLEPGLYSLRIHFRDPGKYVLIFFEDGQKVLINIITVDK